MAIKVLVGMEASGRVREAFRARGFEAFSCDLLPAEDESPHHFVGDAIEVAKSLKPALGIFHPPCTYLARSGAWALSDPDFDKYPGIGYHQAVGGTTLTGQSRREARAKALELGKAIMGLSIDFIAIENPVGGLSGVLGSPSQVLQPYQFGDNASKATCLWLKNLPKLVPTNFVQPRIVQGRQRWANQTDSGQNVLGVSSERWKERSRTYSGIAEAMAKQWGDFLLKGGEVQLNLWETKRNGDGMIGKKT
jgi:hypothetical protein